MNKRQTLISNFGMIIKSGNEFSALREDRRKLSEILGKVKKQALAGVSTKELDESAEAKILKAIGFAK